MAVDNPLMAVEAARRDLNAMANRVRAGGMTAETFFALYASATRWLDEAESHLDQRVKPSLFDVPLGRFRTVRHLAVIDGDRP